MLKADLTGKTTQMQIAENLNAGGYNRKVPENTVGYGVAELQLIKECPC